MPSFGDRYSMPIPPAPPDVVIVLSAGELGLPLPSAPSPPNGRTVRPLSAGEPTWWESGPQDCCSALSSAMPVEPTAAAAPMESSALRAAAVADEGQLGAGAGWPWAERSAGSTRASTPTSDERIKQYTGPRWMRVWGAMRSYFPR